MGLYEIGQKRDVCHDPLLWKGEWDGHLKQSAVHTWLEIDSYHRYIHLVHTSSTCLSVSKVARRTKSYHAYPLVSSDMAGWKIPEVNGGFINGKSLISMVHGFIHLPASHVTDDTGGSHVLRGGPEPCSKKIRGRSLFGEMCVTGSDHADKANGHLPNHHQISLIIKYH